MDYKEILGGKIAKLEALWATYRDKLEVDEFNEIKLIIDNARLSIDGRLDSLDYDVRDDAIMNWHAKLDNAISSLKSRFEENEIEK